MSFFEKTEKKPTSLEIRQKERENERRLIEQKTREYERRVNELDARFKGGEIPEKEWKAEIEKMKKIREEIEKKKTAL